MQLSNDGKITERGVYEKYALAESFDKSSPITDETSSKENTITLWCSATEVNSPGDLQGPEYDGVKNSIIMAIGRRDLDRETDDPSGIMRGIYFGARGVQIARYVKMELGGRQDVSYKDLTEPDIREYIDKTVHEYRSWLYVFGLCDMDELNRIGPQLFIDIATSINVNKVFRALKLLIKLTPITPFDIAALRRLRDKLELLEAAA